MPLTEVIVLIPEERVGDFYRVVGAWMTGASAAEDQRPRRGRPRRADGGEPEKLSSSSRYAPLHKHLANVPKRTKNYEMSFEEITTVMGAALPQSAYDHRAWWANTASHSQALAWISAGWRVEGVDMEKRLITLVRNS